MFKAPLSALAPPMYPDARAAAPLIMASQEYTNAFNRYQAERQARLGPLQSLAGVGQTATQQIGQAGQNYASNAGEAMMSGAAARASGYMGQANALSSALGAGLNYSQNQQLINRMPQQ